MPTVECLQQQQHYDDNDELINWHWGEAKNSIAPFDANVFNAADGSTYNEGMYDDDGTKEMDLKFLLWSKTSR